jgi:DNA-binding NtrC family response regulator
VRLLAATNADLKELLAAGRLRRDLFFRLQGFTVTLPPLRERPADIMPLARFFVAHASQRAGRSPPDFTPEAEEILVRQFWPGNARELRNVLERAVMLVASGGIEAHHLGVDSGPRRPMRSDVAPISAEREVTLHGRESERRRIEEALRRTSGNQTEAAKLLGISRRALLNKLDRFGFGRPRRDAKVSGRG